MDGASTGLVRHVFRLLREARDNNHPVPWILLENVEALLDRHGEDPPVISYVVNQLMELGYGSWAYRIVSSAAFGLPNRRRRVFVVASLHGDARDVLLAQGIQGCMGGCQEVLNGRRCWACHQKALAARDPDGGDEDVSFAIDLGNAMSAPGEDVVPTFTTCNDRLLLLLPDGRRGMLRIEDAERLQGLPTDWTVSCYPIAAPGVIPPRGLRGNNQAELETQTSRRWDLLGNAVTVPVGRWLGERLASPYAYKYHGVGVSDRRIDHLLAGPAAGGAPAPAARTEPNIWSFVCADELQEAVLFPYLVKDQAAVEEVVPEVPEDETEAAAMEAAAEVEAAAAAGEGSGLDQPITPQEMFQASILERFQAGKVARKGSVQQPWDKVSWPRCGWWVRGMGAFAAVGVSDSPILAPFQPLGEFIEELGREPTAEECRSYAGRLQVSLRMPGYCYPYSYFWNTKPIPTFFLLQERGWQISRGLQSRLGGTQEHTREVAQVARLEGLISDSDMVGTLVWAPDGSKAGIYWPGEVIDPLNPTPGKSLPPYALEKLTPVQRRVSLPGKAAESATPEDIAANRRVLVSFFPMSTPGEPAEWAWVNPAALKPWGQEPEQTKLEKDATEASKAGHLRLRDKLTRALKDARLTAALKEGKAGREVETLRKARAAVAAGAVDLKRRCGRCKTCVYPFSGTRRYDCLVQRMKAAALSGHAGAQVALCGPRATGARVAVWWDGNQTFYEGVVCSFDPITTEHAVAYDDGELGLHRLWQHDERIRVLNEPVAWPAAAAGAMERLQAAHARLAASKVLKDAHKAEMASAGVAAVSEIMQTTVDVEEEAAAAAAESHRQSILAHEMESLNMIPRADEPVAPPVAPVERGGSGGSSAEPVTPLGAAVAPPPRFQTRGKRVNVEDMLFEDEDDGEWMPGKGGRRKKKGGSGGGRGWGKKVRVE